MNKEVPKKDKNAKMEKKNNLFAGSNDAFEITVEIPEHLKRKNGPLGIVLRIEPRTGRSQFIAFIIPDTEMAVINCTGCGRSMVAGKEETPVCSKCGKRHTRSTHGTSAGNGGWEPEGVKTKIEIHIAPLAEVLQPITKEKQEKIIALLRQ